MVVYPNFALGGESAVMYMRIGNAVLFSGLNSDGTSTINQAELILGLITTKEQWSHSELVFYDVQTHRGYTGHKIGTYVISRVTLKPGATIDVEEWVDLKPGASEFASIMSSEILAALHPYIN